MKRFAMLPLLAVTLLLQAAVAQADYTVWEQNGVPVRQGHHIEWQKTTCPGDAGELIVAWSDTRDQLRDLFAQKIDDEGNVLWAANGLLVNGAYSRQEDPVLESDRNGGAFISWVDFRADSAGDIYSQHIAPDGSLMLDTDGVPISTVNNVQIAINMCYDENGGVFISWNDSRTGDTDLYITHLLADGSIAAGFDLNGTPVVTEPGEQVSVSMVSDTQGGAWITWTDKRIQDNHNIYIQHVLSDGSMELEQNGYLVCGADGIQTSPKLAPDALGGVFISWFDKRTDNFGDIYLQHLNSAGAISFTADGVPISNNQDKEEKNNRVVNAGSGLVIVMWQDNRNDENNIIGDVYAQKVSTSDLVWTPGGVPVCTAPEEQVNARMTSDLAGGAFISWTDYRNGGTFGYEDIYLQHMDSAGNALWGDGDSDGMPASTETGSQHSPSVRADQNGGAFVSWGDLRYGSIGIFSNCLDENGDVRFDEPNGVELVWGIDGNASNLTSVDAGDNSVIFIWEDRRFSSSVIAAQKLDGGGVAQWVSNGAVPHADFNEREQRDPRALPDGNNGLFIAFTWGPDLGTAAFLTRLGSTGEPLWADPVCVTEAYNVYPTDYQKDIQICEDNSGGVIATWTDHNEDIDPINSKIFAQRFSPTGDRLWGNGGVQLSFSSDATENVALAIAADGDGGAYILWQFGSWGDFNLRMQHIDTNGNVVSGWDPNGMDACTASGNQLKGTLTTQVSGSGFPGVYVIWNDPRESANGADIFGQLVLYDGSLQWVENGVLLVTEISDQEFSRVRPDGESGFYLLWKDFSSGTDYNIYLQHYDATGTPLWSDGNTALCEASNDQQGADFIVFDRDGENRMIGTWADLRMNMHYDLYGQEIAADGSHLWAGNDGAIVNNFFHHQKFPTISYDGEFGAFIGWVDMRSSGKEDLQNIYAQRVNIDLWGVAPSTVVPVDWALLASYPNPFNPTATVRLQLQSPLQRGELAIFNITGQKVATLATGGFTAGTHQYDWLADEMPSGLYIVRLAGSERQVSHKMLLIK
ncbi:T9SS type A sorting domain-containing protein [bacterium]|nr:T9SS type A sorting domain-containing protein [bacterium]